MRQDNIIYMDNNATVPSSQNVLEAVESLRGLPLNASSIHSYGRKARGLVESARECVTKLTNPRNARVIFTSSGTESNNLAICGLEKHKILVSAGEHASVLKIGAHENTIPLTSDGIVDIASLQALLSQYAGEKIVVSVMLANNETGVIQPLKRIAEIVHANGGLVHSDAAQAFGKIDVDMAELGVDMLTISAHKFGGLHGAGALVVGKHVPLASIIKGGSQEQGYRAGTENIAAIHGLGVATGNVSASIAAMADIAKLRDRLENEILQISPDVIIFGKNVKRLPNTSMIAMPGVMSETQVMHFDMEGIAVSSGSACSSGKVETSHVLLAMGVDTEVAKSAIRVSLGLNTTDTEIDRFVAAWNALYKRAGNKKAA